MTSQRDFELVLKQKLQGAGIENAKFADQIEATADKVVDRLRRLFVAPVTNYIAGQASVVDDVVAQPSRYAYPLATVLAVVALHPELDRDRLHQQITSTRRPSRVIVFRRVGRHRPGHRRRGLATILDDVINAAAATRCFTR